MTRPTTYQDLLTRTRALIATSDRVPVVGISGHGGSGKSTQSEQLGSDLGLTPDQVVPTDCFYATACGPNAGMWEQHDWSMLEMLVKDVGREGIRLFHERTRDWFDLAVWIDMDPLSAGARAKARNILQGDDQSELDLWDTKWIPEGHQYVAEVGPAHLADLVLEAG